MTESVKKKASPAKRRRRTKPSANNDPLSGKIVGNCELIEKINEGGTSLIYKAHNRSFNLPRVVKILKPTLAFETDNYRRFLQEAQLTARLDHPHILRIFDTGEVDNNFFIEMEFVEGRTLRTHMESSYRLSETEVLSICEQIVKALEYAHAVEIDSPEGGVVRGILHRDLKPENIMITTNKLVKLMDFGAAKPLSVNTQTMQGNIVGTPHYMSPEQVNGEKLDVRSDFFSLGVILYEMFSGHRPFEAENLAALIWRIDECKYERLRKKRPAVSPLSEELVDRLLSRKQDYRPNSARELNEQLRICIQNQSIWRGGQKVRVPFSIRKSFPTLSLVFSSMALALSGYTAYLAYDGTLGVTAKSHQVELQSSLKKAIEAEKGGNLNDALLIYDLIPAPENGGDPAIFLESRLRLARIYFEERNQLTKARSLLENLKDSYSDPAIHAYLGRIYFRLALYMEAKERFERAFSSEKPTVLRNERDFDEKDFEFQNRYVYATALDKQWVYIEKDPDILQQAIEGYKEYLVRKSCDPSSDDGKCIEVRKRVEELEKFIDSPDNLG